MIDIHSHFLPGIDDGAKDVKESIRMLTSAFKQGVARCVGTPHAFIHSDRDVADFLAKRALSVEKLEEALSGNGESIPELIYGAEIYLDNDITSYSDIKKLCITGTDLLLVELDTDKINPQYSEWLYTLSLKGIIPVIAHFERYPYFEELIADMDDITAVYQMNCRTFLKRSWRKYLLEKSLSGENFIVSSDMHNTGSRKCLMKKACGKVRTHYPELADRLFCDTVKQFM